MTLRTNQQIYSETYEEEACATGQESSTALEVMDLFCGAGGLSLGLERAGFRTALAVDKWRPAQETYAVNFPGTPFLHADLHQLQGIDLLAAGGLGPNDRPRLIAGGPPCQGFSSAGRREPADPRNTLVGSFARLVAELRPEFFLFENVEGFLTAGQGAAVFALLDPTIEAGYQIHLRKVNAANYGVPQLRKRVIALGALGTGPLFPLPTHSAYGAPGARLAGGYLPPSPSLREAIGDLETTSSHLAGHSRQPLGGLDLERCLTLKPGQTMRDLPLHLQHASYLRRAKRRVKDGTPTERRGGAPAGLRKLKPDEPSKAITSAAITEFLHPFQEGFLTIRECARIQTFPDTFDFRGTRSEQALLIGNAVPPRFAEVLGHSIVAAAQLRERATATSTQGRLLSFSPTLSTGMSPALTNVVEEVKKRYGLTAPEESATQLPLYA